MIIGKRYKVEQTDPLNVTLSERHTATKGQHAGEETWEIIGYFPRPQDALKALVDMEVNASLTDLKTVCAKIDQLKEWITETFLSRAGEERGRRE